MKRLIAVLVGVAGVGEAARPAGAQVAASGQAASASPSGQAAARAPSQAEARLLQALQANPATAPYPFSTEPRGSKVLLRGRVGAKIVHDVAIRMAIDLGVPVEDGIVIDTAFNPPGRGGFGTVPGPGPNLAGGMGFGGPAAFGNYGLVPSGFGGYGAPAMGGGYGPGSAGLGGYPGGLPPVAAFPSAGSYGGAPSLLPPPIFGRYDDPFYGFDPPAVVYPPWWAALNAQRVQSNAAFNASSPAAAGPAGAMVNPTAAMGGVAGNGSQGTFAPGAAANNFGVGSNPPGTPIVAIGGAAPANTTETDVGPIPDGTIDMEIDGAGVATIRGAVPTIEDRLAVGQRIAQTAGVSQVINLLTVKPSLGKAASATGHAPANNPIAGNPPPPPAPDGAAPDPALNPIVSTPRAANPPRADATGDAAIAERASRALADRAAVLGAPVQVKVRDGVATVAGKVGSVYEAMLAYRAVQQTPGVRSIDDKLEFPVPDGAPGSNPLIDKGRPDDVEPYLEAQIRRQVGDLAHVDRVRITADALDLRGTLARAEDRDRFDAILRSIPILRGYQIRADLPVAAP